MTKVIPLASRRAAPLASISTDPLELIQLHAQAHNALSTALHCLAQPECSPQHLKTATARAVRAATLLKRASAASAGAVAEGGAA